MAAVRVLPLSVSDTLCQRPVPRAAMVPLASVRWLPLVLLLRMDHAPLSATRR